MTTKAFLWGMRFISLLAVIGTVMLVLYTSPYLDQNPDDKVMINVILLNASLFLSLTGIFTLFLFYLRRKASGNELLGAHLGVSFRQGLLLSISVIALLVLQSFRILTWWDGLLAIGAIMMVELYFLAR